MRLRCLLRVKHKLISWYEEVKEKVEVKLKTKIAGVLVAASMVVGTAAFGASSGYDSQVDSGGTIKYFSNQRTSSTNVSNKYTQGGGGQTLGLVSCTDYGVVVANDLNFKLNVSRTFPSSSGKCFRVRMTRTTPADTNGALPGNGLTTYVGTLTY